MACGWSGGLIRLVGGLISECVNRGSGWDGGGRVVR